MKVKVFSEEMFVSYVEVFSIFLKVHLDEGIERDTREGFIVCINQ